jgi:8-oxo-dGTP diphosphatase
MSVTRFVRPILTVDIALFTLLNRKLHVLLVQRDRDPHQGKLALPGGYVHADKDLDLEDAAHRVMRTKLGMDVSYMEQLITVGGQSRDPRGWSASVAFIAMISPDHLTETREFYPVEQSDIPALAFDHNDIVAIAVKRLRDKTSYSSLPLFLMPKTFTIFELQQVYEAMMGYEIHKATFRRRILELGIIEPTGEVLEGDHRPAALYRASETSVSLFKKELLWAS